MKRISTLVTFFMLVAVFLPIYANATTTPSSSTISLTVMLKNQSVSASFKDFVEKNGGKIVKEIPELGAVEVRGKADLIPILQKNSDVNSVSPIIKMELPAVKKVAVTPSSLAALDQQKNLSDQIYHANNDFPYVANSLLNDPHAVKPTVINPGGHGGRLVSSFPECMDRQRKNGALSAWNHLQLDKT